MAEYDPSLDDEQNNSDQEDYLASTPSEDEVRPLFGKMQAHAAGASTPEEKDKWERKLDEAKKLYQEKAGRNEWLGVAQTLADAVTRGAAAAQGLRTGVDMSHLEMGVGHDYGQDTDRAFREYQSDVGQAERGRAQDIGLQSAQARAKAQETARTERLAQQKQLADDRIQQQKDNATTQAGLREKSITAQETRATARDTARQTKEEEKATAGQLQELNRNKQALQGAALSYQRAQDLSGKEQEKALERASDLLGKSGLPDTEIENIRQNEIVPGRLFGTRKDYSHAAQAAQERLKTLDQAIQQLKAKKSGGAASSTTQDQPSESAGTSGASPQAAPTPVPDGHVKVRSTSGAIFAVPQDKLQAALARGYTQVQ